MSIEPAWPMLTVWIWAGISSSLWLPPSESLLQRWRKIRWSWGILTIVTVRARTTWPGSEPPMWWVSYTLLNYQCFQDSRPKLIGLWQSKSAELCWGSSGGGPSSQVGLLGQSDGYVLILTPAIAPHFPPNTIFVALDLPFTTRVQIVEMSG